MSPWPNKLFQREIPNRIYLKVNSLIEREKDIFSKISYCQSITMEAERVLKSKQTNLCSHHDIAEKKNPAFD